MGVKDEVGVLRAKDSRGLPLGCQDASEVVQRQLVHLNSQIACWMKLQIARRATKKDGFVTSKRACCDKLRFLNEALRYRRAAVHLVLNPRYR